MRIFVAVLFIFIMGVTAGAGAGQKTPAQAQYGPEAPPAVVDTPSPLPEPLFEPPSGSSGGTLPFTP